MRSIRIVLAVLLAAAPAVARAQSLPSPELPPVNMTHGPELDAHAGVSTSDSIAGGTAGGSVQWDMTPRFAVDAGASWFNRGTGANAFSVDGTALLNIVRKQTATPFVGAGFGIYHASFDSSASMPSFYRDRLPANPIGSTSAFTDPMLRLVAGIDIGGVPSESRWIVRPEVAALIIMANGTSETVFTATVSVGYQFRPSGRGNATRP